jgi:drug/metabolite transporter (DMT)-like permease
MSRLRLEQVNRAWLLLGLGLAAAIVAIAVGALTLPDWTNPTKRDYGQSAVFIVAGIVLAAAGYVWVAWRIRRAR